MNQIAKLPLVKQLNELGPQFSEMARSHNLVNFKTEIAYACGILESNSYLLKIAQNNPSSIRNAVLNIAGTGITLNPLHQHAYLVPRKGEVCLDISYKGLMHLAQDTGSIVWVHVDIVMEKDTFELGLAGERPLHKLNPFQKDRGKQEGAYCVAKLHDGSYMTVTMGMEDIFEIRDQSEAYKAYKSGKVSQCPWVNFESEMIKKTVIKRAYKFWPKADVRFKKAIEVVNEHEGIDFQNNEDVIEYKPIDYERRYEQIDKIKSLLSELCEGFTNEQKIALLKETTGFVNFSDVEIQDNKSLDKIELNLLTKKTDKEAGDNNPLPVVKKEDAIEAEVLDPKVEETKLAKIARELKEQTAAAVIDTKPKNAKSATFTINQ